MKCNPLPRPAFAPFASALLLAGCASIGQAPLVYSSQTTFGVDISSTSAANPGVSLNLGFKQTDVAYVPVAVENKGSGASLGIQTIAAEFGQDESGTNQAQVRQAIEVKLQSFNAAQESEARARAAEADRLRARDEAFAQRLRVQNALAALALVPATPPAPPAAAASAAPSMEAVQAAQVASQQREAALAKLREQVVGIQGQGAALPALPSDIDLRSLKAALVQAETTLQSTLALATQAYEQAQKDRAAAAQQRFAARQALDQVESMLVTKKRDAMSVYGSFNSLTEGEAANSAPRVGVNLGKVFSTGMAAQNLTEAEKSKAQAGCVLQVMAAMGVATAASQPASAPVEVLRAASSACGQRSLQ